MGRQLRSLSGQVVAITGGGRGIGRATAAALIAEGARVAIGDVDAPLAERTASELGSGTVGLPLDVTDKASFTSFLDEVDSRVGPLDVLVNNAGIMPVGPFVDESDAATEKLGESTSAASRAAVLEFVLEGLHRGKRLNKTEMDGTAVYGG